LSSTFAEIANASTLSDLHFFTTSSASAIEDVQVMTTFQPFDASKLAVAAPTPLLPPVIIATLLSDEDI
jgi:hypothetical protein